ncbi:hypothetical protein MKEN_00680900 [Mycena kentingensis (nom. inval.)]|nr:hypothetical protein MKEN_00680900 [Mycena kentingensis (nom. inval.)]
MTKLHLKRTPQEEADRRARKRRKTERRSSSHKPSAKEPRRKWASDDESDEYNSPPRSRRRRRSLSPASSPEPGPGPSAAYKPDYATLLAELEDARFREKMASAFDDDDRADALEARMNDYAHVPGRWRAHNESVFGSATAAQYADEELFGMDPAQMDDEEYAEWVRSGMYRKTHAREYAEQQERKAIQSARRAQEKAARAETARLNALAEAESRRKRLEKELRRMEFAREDYERRWAALLSPASRSKALTFVDVPWPVFAAQRQRAKHAEDPPPEISLDALTADAIVAFLVPNKCAGVDGEDKARKEKLRETYLRFHPDKFEGRFMHRISGERDRKLAGNNNVPSPNVVHAVSSPRT